MKKIYSDLTQLVGNTPLVELPRYSQEAGLQTPIIAKVESFNPGGSVKDRIGVAMIADAEEKGLLQPDSIIVEATSGNTGIGIAWVAAAKGYKVILTMPETMSLERQNLLKALGVDLRLTPGNLGMGGAIDEADRLTETLPNAIMLKQFDNPANPAIHRATTAEEIWADTDGEVDVVIAGVGTGGTLTGISQRLHELNPNIECIAIEPERSPVLTGGDAGPHMIQGIGAGFQPINYDPTHVKEVVRVSDQDAIKASRLVARQEGLLVGISSGAALHTAVQYALQPGNEHKRIVVILADTGERYLSTALYAFDDYPL